MTGSFLTFLQKAFNAALMEQLSRNISEDELQQCIGEAIERSRKDLTEILLEKLKRQAPTMLRQERQRTGDFEKRTFQRWAPAFDLFEVILKIIEEVGAEHDAALRPAAIDTNDWTFEAVSHLHARGLLVAREIHNLLRGGYPDGALARWRTLHELTVIALFLQKHSAETAFRYLASFRFAALRAAGQLNEFAERARMKPFSDADLNLLKAECDTLEKQLGARLKKDYDWAGPALNVRSPTFDQIERAVGMDHWRPRYRWASQHNHGGHRPADKLLGMSERVEPAFLVGASDSGFVDPLHMSATSLMQLFATFLLRDSNLDRILMVDIVQAFVDELGEAASSIQNAPSRAEQDENKGNDE